MSARLRSFLERAGLMKPEIDILVFLMDGRTRTVEEIAKNVETVPAPKVYTHVNRLVDQELVQLINDRPKKLKVTSYENLLDKIEKKQLKELQKRDEQVRQEIEQLKQEGFRKVKTEIILEPEPEPFHRRLIEIVKELKAGDEVLAYTPTSLIWSVPENEAKRREQVGSFREVFKKKILKDNVRARYISSLRTFKTRVEIGESSPTEQLVRLKILRENFEKLPITIVDIELPHVTQSFTLAVYGQKYVGIGTKAFTRELNRGVILIGPEIASFFKDLMESVYEVQKERNLVAYFGRMKKENPQKLQSLLRDRIGREMRVDELPYDEYTRLIKEYLKTIDPKTADGYLREYILLRIAEVEKEIKNIEVKK